MKNSLIENSLKRFLKRKVKITLGLMVAFMITGTVGYGEVIEKPIINMEEGINPCTPNENFFDNQWNGIGETKKFEEAELILSQNGITLKSTDKSIELIENSKSVLKVESKDISNSTLINVNNAIKLGKKAKDSQDIKLDLSDDEEYNVGFDLKSNIDYDEFVRNGYTVSGDEIYVNTKNESNGGKAVNGGILVNKGILSSTGSAVQEADNGIIYNYGIIDAQKGQYVTNKGTAYNYGILVSKNFGQDISGEATAYNYGYIKTTNYAQKSSSGGKLYNYGILVSMNYGQDISGEATVYNYGYIKTTRFGQNISSGGKLYNYGIIDNVNGYGQCAANNGTAYNYGIINSRIGGKYANGANYGIITNNGFANPPSLIYVSNSSSTDEYKNYGLLMSEASNIIDVSSGGKATNNGIIVASGIDGVHDNTLQLDNTTNNGVVLDKNLNLVNDKNSRSNKDINNHVLDLNSENISEISGTETKSSYFAKDNGVSIVTDNLEGKVLTGVVQNEKDTTLFTKEGDLTLRDTTIVGYFENDGTLLDVKGDLVLEGESVINGIAGNSRTGYTGDEVKVTTVNLREGGSLTIRENSKVLGAVKGEGTVILKDSEEYHKDGFHVAKLKIKTTGSKNTLSGDTTTGKTKTTVNNLKVTKGVTVSGSGTSTENTKITFRNNIDITGGISFKECKNDDCKDDNCKLDDCYDSVNNTGDKNCGFLKLDAEIVLGDGLASSSGTINIDKITLGTGDDILTIKNNLGKVGEINGNGGNDIVNLEYNEGIHDTFNYNLKDIDTVDLGGNGDKKLWKIGENVNISHSPTTKDTEKTSIKNGTLFGELQGTINEGVDFVNNGSLNNIISNSALEKDGYIKVGIGKGMEVKAGAEYDLDNDTVKNFKENESFIPKKI